MTNQERVENEAYLQGFQAGQERARRIVEKEYEEFKQASMKDSNGCQKSITKVLGHLVYAIAQQKA